MCIEGVTYVGVRKVRIFSDRVVMFGVLWVHAGFSNGTWFSLHPILCHCLKFFGGTDILGA